MKISRHRKVRRNLSFYKNNFGFRKPYQILIDATFCQEALKCKLNIQEQMPKYLESEVKLMTTACVITEVESIGSAAYGAMLIVKKFKVRECGHSKNPVSASECLYSLLGEKNEDHYMIATQDTELTEKVRALQPAPLLYIKYNAIILEKPSTTISALASGKIEEKINDQGFHMSVIQEMKKQTFGETVSLKRKRKHKGPNPLSCKKKQPKIIEQPKTKHRPRHRRTKKPKELTIA